MTEKIVKDYTKRRFLAIVLVSFIVLGITFLGIKYLFKDTAKADTAKVATTIDLNAESIDVPEENNGELLEAFSKSQNLIQQAQMLQNQADMLMEIAVSHTCSDMSRSYRSTKTVPKDNNPMKWVNIKLNPDEQKQRDEYMEKIRQTRKASSSNPSDVNPEGKK